MFFILALNALVKKYDTSGQGISVGEINEIRVLGYADDAAMVEEAVTAMTERLTTFADKAIEKADMKMKLQKTFTQHVQVQEAVSTATTAEINKKESSYKHVCAFAKAGCTARFKTKKGMLRHKCSCRFGYTWISEKQYEVAEILDVFGRIERRLFLVRWTNYPGEDSWQSGHMLMEDGCMESIKEFWIKSGKNPAQDYYPPPDGKSRCWICAWTCKKPDDGRYLKAHLTRSGHWWDAQRAHVTAKKDIKRDKIEQRQETMAPVKWGDKEVRNCWRFEYLGSLVQCDGSHIPDVLRRVAMAKARAGALRHIWASTTLTLTLKLRLYTAACCSIMTYGAEAWHLDEQTCRILRGANAFMLSHITGKTKRQEAKEAECTFAILPWIRARRLRWVGHILRMSDPDEHNRPRMVKRALKHIYDNNAEGDILSDIPKSAKSWETLQKLAADRDWWRAQVKVIKNKCKFNQHKHEFKRDNDGRVADLRL